jgi:biopolymer transport protein ExbD
MKNHFLNIMVGCLGLGLGFTVLYSCGLFPTPARTGNHAQIITIAGDGSLSMAGKQMNLSQLSSNLKETRETPALSVTIQADTNTDYKRIQEVVDTCKAAGVTNVSLHTSAKP